MLIRKSILLLAGCLLTGNIVFAQSEKLKDVVNNLAFFNKQKDLKYLAEAKKAVDRSIVTKADSSNFTKNIYKMVVYASIAYLDSTNALNQPANFQEQVAALIDQSEKNKRSIKYEREIAYSKRCLSNGYMRAAFKENKANNFANALTLFQKAQALTPEVPTLNVYMAYTYQKLGQHREAIKYYVDLINSGDTKLPYYETVINLYKSLGDTSQALSMIKKGREVHPKNKFLLFEEVNIYNNKRDYAALRKLISDLVSLEPNDTEIMFLAASCFDNLKEYDQAESFYLKAIELNPNNYDAIYNLGLLYLRTATLKRNSDIHEENLKRSRQWLEKAHEISPNDLNCLKVLRMLYAETQNNDQLEKVNIQIKQLTNY
jgi:tetratricopeptide (TPR) repeat protein